MLLIGWQEGHRQVRTLQQNPLATVVDISGCGTGCSSLWQPQLSVNATNRQPAYAWQMAIKMCVQKG